MKNFVRTHKRAVLLSLAALLIIAASIGGTLAWLTSKPSGIVNTFTPGEVPNEVVEEFDDGVTTKSNVRVKNTGNVDAYIRVALVPIWRNADGTGAGYPAAAVNPDDYGMDSDWFKQGSYYYYSKSVAPNKVTALLLTSFTAPATPTNEPEGTYYELQVLAQSIQADGTDTGGISPAELAWKDVGVQGGKLIAKTLTP